MPIRKMKARQTLTLNTLTVPEWLCLELAELTVGPRVRWSSDAEMRTAWDAVADELVEQHRESTGWPTRPGAWWRWSRPEALDDVDVVIGDPSWRQTAALLDAGELTAAERDRLPGLLTAELKCRRGRAGMDPPAWLPELESLADRLGVEVDRG